MADIDGSYHHDTPLTCPWCGAELDGTTVASDSGGEHRPIDEHNPAAKPEPGMLGVCAKCAGLQVYEETDGIGSLRKPTSEEEDEAHENPLVRQMQNAILTFIHNDRKPPVSDPSTDPDAHDDWDVKVSFTINGPGVITRMKSKVPADLLIDLFESLIAEIKEREQ